MAIQKNLITSSTTMLLLKLLENTDMYGYQMIEELAKKSNNIFSLKAGTLYPLLHNLEKKDVVSSYYQIADNTRERKYYSITKKGKGLLAEKKSEWDEYTKAVNNVLKEGDAIATIC